LKTTFTTFEKGLRGTVATVDETALIAPLACVARIDSNNLAADVLSLVFKKLPELSEAPGVKTPACLSVSDLNTLPNVSKVLNDDSCTRLDTVKDRTGDNVVAIPSEALFTSSEASKVSLGTLRTVGLQGTFKAKSTVDNFFPVAFSVKTIIGTNRRMSNSQINTDSLSIRSKPNIRQADNDVKVELPLSVNEVGGRSGTSDSIFGVFRNRETDFKSSLSRSEIHDAFIPINLEGMQIIPRWTKLRFWAGDLLPLFLTRQSGLNGLRRFLSGLNMQVRNKAGISVLTITVGKFMQSISVAVPLFISHTAYCIKRLRELPHCFMQSLGLLIGWLKPYYDCPIHSYIIPYIWRFYSSHIISLRVALALIL
jgi:hypothetical protein